ncbi:unnamed protein product [Periconia digitata]|uniref:Uncharacterized protein n=1 Tax=Periconia digitata TaxID=1303443 RepID=A0A9W4UNN9_9PLEO|nr:unnamed protein product [Periconia digitata]
MTYRTLHLQLHLSFSPHHRAFLTTRPVTFPPPSPSSSTPFPYLPKPQHQAPHKSHTYITITAAKMSWMDSWSRPSKSQATPPPLYLTTPDVPYCRSCGRVISQRRTQQPSKKTQEIKYCSARCRNTKPGPVDRRIESVFTALLDGATAESLKGKEGEGGDGGAVEARKAAGTESSSAVHHKGKKDHKKAKKAIKGDPRIIVECRTVEEIVFQHEKDPEKVFGRRKNRAARGVVERPEDWRSVDMVDDPASPSASRQHVARDSLHSVSADDANGRSGSTSSELDEEEEGSGGVSLNAASSEGAQLDKATSAASEDVVPLYGYGGGKIRPPQSQSSINGSIGGEKGWAERIEETDEMKAKRREGQRRADEREMVRRAARRLVAFGSAAADGEGEERRKCEAVMKGVVVEASFAKGEWGIRWREKV